MMSCVLEGLFGFAISTFYDFENGERDFGETDFDDSERTFLSTTDGVVMFDYAVPTSQGPVRIEGRCSNVFSLAVFLSNVLSIRSNCTINYIEEDCRFIVQCS